MTVSASQNQLSLTIENTHSFNQHIINYQVQIIRGKCKVYVSMIFLEVLIRIKVKGQNKNKHEDRDSDKAVHGKVAKMVGP